MTKISNSADCFASKYSIPAYCERNVYSLSAGTQMLRNFGNDLRLQDAGGQLMKINLYKRFACRFLLNKLSWEQGIQPDQYQQSLEFLQNYITMEWDALYQQTILEQLDNYIDYYGKIVIFGPPLKRKQQTKNSGLVNKCDSIDRYARATALLLAIQTPPTDSIWTQEIKDAEKHPLLSLREDFSKLVCKGDFIVHQVNVRSFIMHSQYRETMFGEPVVCDQDEFNLIVEQFNKYISMIDGRKAELSTTDTFVGMSYYEFCTKYWILHTISYCSD